MRAGELLSACHLILLHLQRLLSTDGPLALTRLRSVSVLHKRTQGYKQIIALEFEKMNEEEIVVT